MGAVEAAAKECFVRGYYLVIVSDCVVPDSGPENGQSVLLPQTGQLMPVGSLTAKPLLDRAGPAEVAKVYDSATRHVPGEQRWVVQQRFMPDPAATPVRITAVAPDATVETVTGSVLLVGGTAQVPLPEIVIVRLWIVSGVQLLFVTR